jgi:hypothetical protein
MACKNDKKVEQAYTVKKTMEQKPEFNQADSLGFDSFLALFIYDSSFQRQHIHFPIQIYYSDEDFPYDILERETDRLDYTFIDLNKRLPKVFSASDTFITRYHNSEDTFYYEIMGDHNGIYKTYKFVRNNGTYKLFEIEDLTD